MARLPFLAVLIALGAPLDADAQIYAWRDVNGTLVLSDRKLDDGAMTYLVPEAPGIRATTPMPDAIVREQFEPMIREHAARQALRVELVRAVIQVESGYNPRARSPKGAMGLMQLMPATAAQHGVLDPFNPAENIRAGVRYLKQLLVNYEGRVELALAAYNAGPGAVKKYGGKVPPYRETQNYVARIQNTGTGTAAAPPRQVYRTVEIVDGREVVRYSGRPRENSERLESAERR
jgi:soluble lytic murein transglycosylase-like protein